MNREQLEALACELKALVESAVNGRGVEGFVFVGAVGCVNANGLVVATTLSSDELARFWAAMGRSKARKVNLEGPDE